VEGDHRFFLGWQTHDKVPIKKHETHDGFSLNLKTWVGKPQHWFVSQWRIHSTFNDPTSLMVFLFWYVVVGTKLSPQPLKLGCCFQNSWALSLYRLCVYLRLSTSWAQTFANHRAQSLTIGFVTLWKPWMSNLSYKSLFANKCVCWVDECTMLLKANFAMAKSSI